MVISAINYTAIILVLLAGPALIICIAFYKYLIKIIEGDKSKKTLIQSKMLLNRDLKQYLESNESVFQAEIHATCEKYLIELLKKNKNSRELLIRTAAEEIVNDIKENYLRGKGNKKRITTIVLNVLRTGEKELLNDLIYEDIKKNVMLNTGRADNNFDTDFIIN
ncbi:hypothetical protein Dfri01_59010 [Dyadobacter frigoris]|uniref:hypothetical protein n=1 Tax=Dyadobacter frigoris TaxID=2576211 RepID=UPI0024A54304|nr:hypothetical protein [Dyadobacter frigoris]GLU56440.1 hypothetical protein Dfri01_59010 [Dyadobacter frigoris]